MISSRTRGTLLAFIIALAAFLRLSLLDRVPPGFYSDEASIAYDAYSIMLTGRDRMGVLLPAFPCGFGFWISGLPHYAAIPSIALFGLNEFGARFPSALAGILTVLLTYHVVKLRFTAGAALWASLLLAIAPWHVHLSRGGTGYILLPFFFMLALYFFFKGLQGKTALFYLAALSFGLAFYSYFPARIFIPTSLLGLLAIYRKELPTRRHLAGGFLVLLLALTPAILFAITEPEHFFLRYKQIMLHRGGGNEALVFLRNYLAHLSPAFLYMKGDVNVRHAPRGFGQLLLFEFPLAVAGLAACARNIKKRDARFLIFWLLTYPIPASFTTENIPHALRSVTALPLPQILSGLGICAIGTVVQSLGGWKRRLAITGAVLYGVGAAANAVLFFHHYFLRYPVYSARDWDYGWREAIACAKADEGRYDRVVMTVLSVGPPTLYPPFYLNYAPALYQRSKLAGSTYEFIPPEILNPLAPRLRGRTLCIVREEELRGMPPRELIYFPDGGIAFKIIELVDGVPVSGKRMGSY